MTFFENTDHLYKILGGFFKLLSSDGQIGPKLLGSNLKLQFNYKNPDGFIFIDLSGDEPQFFFGEQPSKPDVEMTMKADTAHKFWQGKVNLPVALARREITAKGPIPKILKLLPIIKPAYKLYPNYLAQL